MYRKLNPAGSTPREISEVVNNLVEGKSNNTGIITLAVASATATTLNDERIGYESIILFMPTTANAASAMTNLYVSARAKGSATLTHSANTSADKTYSYVVIA
jgi:hypothetical protein